MTAPQLLELPLDENLLKVLSSDSRREILRLLAERRMTGAELATRLDLGKPAVAEHLKKLLDAELIERFDDDERRWVYYGLAPRGRSILEPQKVRFYLVLAVAVMGLVVGMAMAFGFVMFLQSTPDGAALPGMSEEGDSRGQLAGQADALAPDALAQGGAAPPAQSPVRSVPPGEDIVPTLDAGGETAPVLTPGSQRVVLNATRSIPRAALVPGVVVEAIDTINGTLTLQLPAEVADELLAAAGAVATNLTAVADDVAPTLGVPSSAFAMVGTAATAPPAGDAAFAADASSADSLGASSPSSGSGAPSVADPGSDAAAPATTGSGNDGTAATGGDPVSPDALEVAGTLEGTTIASSSADPSEPTTLVAATSTVAPTGSLQALAGTGKVALDTPAGGDTTATIAPVLVIDDAPITLTFAEPADASRASGALSGQSGGLAASPPAERASDATLGTEGVQAPRQGTLLPVFALLAATGLAVVVRTRRSA